MKIKNYISVAMLALVGMAFTGCDAKDEPEYVGAQTPSDAQRVYFAKSSMSKTVAADETVVNVPVYRPENADAEQLTVQLTVTDAAGVFDIPSSVTFAPGSDVAQIPVRFTTGAMTPNTPYPIVIAIDEANADVYGLTQTTLTLNFEQMTEWQLFGYDPELGRNGYGVWTLGSPFSGFFMNMRVFERHIPSNPKEIQYAVQLNIPGNINGSIAEEDIDTSNTDFSDPEWITAINMSSSDGGKTIEIPVQQCVFNSTVVFGEASVLYPSSFPDNESYFDEVAGTFFLNLMYADNEGAWNPAINPIVLYGYADTNEYSLNVTNSGQVKIGGVDYQVIGFTFPETVDYVLYTVVKGELDEEQIAEVAAKIADPKQEEYTVETLEEVGNITLDFPTSDTYTIVAVGMHLDTTGAAEAKVTASVTFNYETFDPYLGWTTITDQGTYTDYLMSALYGGQIPPATYNVTIDKSDDYEGLYRIANPYANYPYNEAIGAEIEAFGCIEIEAADPTMVYIPLSNLGIIADGETTQLASYGYYLLANDYAPEDIPAPFWGTLTGSEVKFNPIGNDQNFTFLVGFDGKIAGGLDLAFDANLAASEAPAAKPAKKANISKGNASLRSLAGKPAKAMAFPAHFHATKKATKSNVAKTAINPNAARRR